MVSNGLNSVDFRAFDSKYREQYYCAEFSLGVAQQIAAISLKNRAFFDRFRLPFSMLSVDSSRVFDHVFGLFTSL